jgi:CubicO group peptidase (beta-lactamase class C family)
MSRTLSAHELARLDTLIDSVLQTRKVPGGALAIVRGGSTVYAKGFGYRDMRTKAPLRATTAYPIASTTKSINGTLIGMLVDAGHLKWDAPVQRYLPGFRLGDDSTSAQVTVRDLVLMRTGLPRHDWVWIGNPTGRRELVSRLAHLPLSAGFRQRFQYCNLSVTAAGHVAEQVMGEPWESLVQRWIFARLGMRHTRCGPPAHRNQTLSYHETRRRKLIVGRRFAADATAPSGGAVYSTVGDMARWLSFNLNGGRVAGKRLMGASTLAELHAPQMAIGDHALAVLPADAAYSLGWVVASYNGHRCLSHGGYLHDVSSSIMFFPDSGIGVVCFVNFGGPGLVDLIGRSAFDVTMGMPHAQSVSDKMAAYEEKIVATRKRLLSVPRIPQTSPAQKLAAYVGRYEHPGYGEIRIQKRGRDLLLRRAQLSVPLKHWHYDVWVAEESDVWPIHSAHIFDRSSRLQFHADVDGAIASLTIPLEPEVQPIQFRRCVSRKRVTTRARSGTNN